MNLIPHENLKPHSRLLNYGIATLFAALVLSANLLAQKVNIPDVGTTGQSLAAKVVGNYTAPPPNLVTTSTTGGAVTGNGDMALIVGGDSKALKFYIGKADFFGVLRGAIQPVGSLTLLVPSLNGSSYALHQNVGPATITGEFTNVDYGLTLTSWVATSENTGVIHLRNTGTKPLSFGTLLEEGFSGSTGNPATYGATTNATWVKVSPDTVYLELGNQLHNALGTSPFEGRIADFRLFDKALDGTSLMRFDSNPNFPWKGPIQPMLSWSALGKTEPKILGENVSINANDLHGGSVTFKGDQSSELSLGAIPFPERQFTISTWINIGAIHPKSSIVTAQIPYTLPYGTGLPYPYVRGLSLSLVNGALSATLNQSGGFNKATEMFYADATNQFTATSSRPLPTNEWVQVATTYDGNILRIFCNGAQVGATESFPTGINGMMGWNKMVTHLGDTSVIHHGCAPLGILMQSVVGANASSNAQGSLSFSIPVGGEASIVVAAVTDRNTENYLQAAQEQISNATSASLAKLFDAHNDWWGNFWSKSYVQISNQKIQDSWYASLYLLACSSTPKSPPPGLYANFITSTQPGWQGDYTLDYNFEGPALAALPDNHMELVDNYAQPLIDQMSRGRAAAEYNFGPSNKGIYFYAHLVPPPGWDDDPVSFEGQKTDSIFAALNCVMRWRYTLDPVYAAKVYAYLRGVADFWDNYLVLDRGVYSDVNDAVSESSGHDTNPATTIAFIQLLYPALVEMSESLHVDANRRPLWNDIIRRLAPLPIVPASSIPSLNALGAPYNSPGVNVIRDSSSGTAFPSPMITVYHDHAIRSSSAGMSCAQAIFPGWNIGLESDADTLRAATNTIWLASQWFDFNNECTFYAGAACVGYDPDTILTNLDTFETYYRYPNYLNDLVLSGAGLHGCSAEMFAIVPATLGAMFLQSYQTNIHLFPDWPVKQDAAFGNLNACGGFLISSEMKGGKIPYVKIQSTAAQECRLVNPWPSSSGTKVLVTSNKSPDRMLSGPILKVPTQRDEVLIFTPE